MKLVLPSPQYKNSFLVAVKEFQKDTEYPLADLHYKEISLEELEKDFELFITKTLSQTHGKNLPAGYVPQTTCWLIDNNEFVGVVRIRHELNENLKKIGGHIGYEIRPSKRRQGYGSKILELALVKAKELGINKILLTCDATNNASRKIIEKNGGVLENQIENPATGIDKLLFWIN